MKYRLLLIFIIIAAFNLSGETMYGKTQKNVWKKPTIVEWNNEGILLGGIALKEMQDFYIWSIDKEQILWYISLDGPRYKTHSKESRSEQISLPYSTVPNGYKQIFPKGDKARLPKVGEMVKIYFCYTMDWYFGPKFETVNAYLRRTDEGFQKVDVDIDYDIENLEKINTYIKKMQIK